MAKPRHLSPVPGKTTGAAIVKIMKLLGHDPMPWQVEAARVIGAVTDDGTPLYPTVVISVPRQAGKTTLMSATCIQRITAIKHARVWLTAQTGNDASQAWKECLKQLQNSPISSLFSNRRSNGSEEITCRLTGGEFKPHPPSEDKMHGKQSDLNIIDEAWAFDEEKGALLMQAITPTQSTRPLAQTIFVSTMGTARSSWFHDYVQRARAGEAGFGIVDYGIGDDEDVTLENILKAHPAYGYTQSEKSIADGMNQLATPAARARAYGNRATGAIATVIPPEAVAAASTDAPPIPPGARVVFAAALDMERTAGAIAAAYHNIETDTTQVEIIDARPGIQWITPRLLDLAARHDNGGIWIDRVGPSATLADTTARQAPPGVNVAHPTANEVTMAAANFFDRVTSDPPRLTFPPHPALAVALEVTERRYLGDGWTWSRRHSRGNIAALEAASLAALAAARVEAPAPAPEIRF